MQPSLHSLRTEDILLARSELQRFIREFFYDRSYLEVDTPIAVISPGTEVHLNYFETKWIDLSGKKTSLYLRSSPELHLKQVLAGGISKAFHLARCFRNKGEMGPWHHPEFTMLEWYEANLKFEAMISQTEQLIHGAANTIKALAKRKRWNLDSPMVPKQFRRIKVSDAFSEFAGINLIDLDPDLSQKAKEAGCVSVRDDDDFETAYFKVLLEIIEPALAKLIGTVLYDYPKSQAALAVVKNGVARRFEFYMASPSSSDLISPTSSASRPEVVELCNGFEELLGENENRQRISESSVLRKLAGNPAVPEDHDFYAALGRGLGPCCGNALGFDRLLALCLGERNLDRAIPFRNASVWRLG